MPVVVKEPRVREPIMSAAEQTRLSWARPVRSLDEVPPAYRSYFAARPADEVFPYAVLTPTFAGFLRRETEKLVYCLDDQLIVLEKTSTEPRCLAFALDAIDVVEMGGVLLKAWLKLQGCANHEDQLTTVTLRFNAVTDRLFKPFVDRIRGARPNPIGLARDSDLGALADAGWLSFKFHNYARQSLLPGDRLIAALGQPEVRRPIIRIGRWSYRRTVILAHVLLLTDRELIIIRDDAESPESFDDTRYGGVWDYVPLSKIRQITYGARDAEVLAVTLGLPRGEQVETLFAADRNAEVERFLNHLVEWAPEASMRRL